MVSSEEGRSSMSQSTEVVDVVVVGARPAGTATAIALARRGRRVVALDRASFPSDTLSTHVLFAGCVVELHRSGALERVLETGAPKLPAVQLSAAGHDVRGHYTPVDGIDYGLCVRRIGLDMALVETARAAGAEVRERCTVTEVLWEGGRAAGVRYTDPDGASRELRARLVVGADGRRSQMAQLLGSDVYRTAENGRGLAFHYVRDPWAGDPEGAAHRDSITQWRVGDTLGMFFPTDQEGGLALFMPPKEDISRFRKDADGVWAEKVASNPGLRRRLAGTEREGKLRSTADVEAFFRVSSGAGWALVGDAGHFKDPVVAQGIRDALRFGRRLGETAAEALDHPEWLDRRLFAWELERDAECLPSFYLGRKHTRTHPVSQLEQEFFREAADDPRLAQELADVFARTRKPQQLFRLDRQLRWFAKAALRRGADRGALVREAVEELRLDARMQWDLAVLRSGRRAGGGTWNRWGRNGWSPRVALRPARPAPSAPVRQRPVDASWNAGADPAPPAGETTPAAASSPPGSAGDGAPPAPRPARRRKQPATTAA
ncbi:NAD(P)/FAD-dependent oxidoreductase [Patulibacter brassicae]|uniref:NAD(P)/FAD-dependent oxidoreductase n=1 Tax=Patulibacter brassicae TaxID=1705717 RepID=A0ABU4VJZ9_9ACTN|nr:NAD(P)/FAD-dependent oxidoreductase [Patulibacter brassicae]MDX8151785.1 NAD(P)/FAD-dependent oxidoreductase [Patulibacter brassicae]